MTIKIGGVVVYLPSLFPKFIKAALALSLFSLTAFPSNAVAQNGFGAADLIENIALNTGGEPYTGEIMVPMGKSMILRFDRSVREVLVGDPDAADIIPLTDRNIYVLGKTLGGTNLTLIGDRKQLLGIVDLQVTYDILNLKKRLHELMPGENIEVRTSGDSVLLSGSVSSSQASIRASQLASNYAPEKVVNMIDIGQSQQVMLAVRFAEVERTAIKALGISTDALFFGDDGSFGGVASSFVNPVESFASAASLFGGFGIGDVGIDVVLDALEERGVVSVLAEPTLIATSGESASFLAGGEFPVPVGTNATSGGVNGVPTVQIDFREFGVRLGFTPTVLGETISLKVSPEVSELDPGSGIETLGITIPGLRTRKATTTVELKNGQSFAIAGLLQKSFIDEIEQLPGFGSTPIIGALMRSARFEREETELAIIITPYIVEPSDPGTLATPADYFVRPHELELFFLGKTEGRQPFDFVPRKQYFEDDTAPASTSTVGVDGAVGYIIE